MFQTLGPLELLIILLIVIALFGAGRIAGVGRALGTSVRDFRREARTGLDDEDDDDCPEGEEAKEKTAVPAARARRGADDAAAPTQMTVEDEREDRGCRGREPDDGRQLGRKRRGRRGSAQPQRVRRLALRGGART